MIANRTRNLNTTMKKINESTMEFSIVDTPNNIYD